MKKILTFIILPLVIIYLGYMLYASIQEPVEFDKASNFRKEVAVDRLKDIRDLQVAFKSKYGRYTGSLDSLINFYKTDSIVVVKQVGSYDDSLAVAQKRVYRDSINILVRDTLIKERGAYIDSIKYIPFSGGDTIIMQAVYKKVSGVNMPLFEACIPFDNLLKGLDRQLIINLKAVREDTGRYPGWKVGDINVPNNNAGNWE